jgi:23S rRNA pseudouridine955/2504/2580 synthase
LSNKDPNNPFSTVTLHSVDEEYAGQRLDNFLLRLLKGVPKSRIYRLLRKGEVRVNKGRVKPDTRLNAGDVVRIAPVRVSQQVSECPSSQFRNRLKRNIVFEDDALIVINKPSGVAVHGGSGVSFGVIEALRAEMPNLKYLELVHRLDRDTSGCLMLAKSRAVLISIQRAFQENTVDKKYCALIKGQWPKGKTMINAPLKKNQLSSGERMVRVDSSGKPSVTHFKVTDKFKDANLLEISLETGRTHQIRVHCQFSNQPIAGDEKYGDRQFNESMRDIGLRRLFLHAKSLSFKHPLSDDWVQVSADLPDELSSVLDKLS